MDESDDRVGNGMPPKRTRFAKGKLGNPKGRRLASKNLDALMLQELDERIVTTEGGRQRQISKRNLQDLKIEYVAASTINERAGNPRTHGRAQIRKLALVIRAHGFTNPVLIDEANVLIAGHGRLKAAQKLGMDTVPAIKLAGLSEAQKHALMLSDNKLGDESSFDCQRRTKNASAGRSKDASVGGFGRPR